MRRRGRHDGHDEEAVQVSPLQVSDACSHACSMLHFCLGAMCDGREELRTIGSEKHNPSQSFALHVYRLEEGRAVTQDGHDGETVPRKKMAEWALRSTLHSLQSKGRSFGKRKREHATGVPYAPYVPFAGDDLGRAVRSPSIEPCCLAVFLCQLGQLGQLSTDPPVRLATVGLV